MMQRRRQQGQLQQTSFTPILERQISEIMKGLSNTYTRNLRTLSEDNIKTIIRYVNAIEIEVSKSTNYRRDIIEVLTRFAKSIGKDNFKDVTRGDIILFLKSFEKPEESDPLHKWIGTYNTYQVHLVRFFKWLYSPDIAPKERPKPSVVNNIPKLKRKETSIYKPTDLWKPDDDLLFLKYCPTKRDKCYHVISRDLGARPHEILNLKIKDIAFKAVPSGRQYVEVTVNGKTGDT